MKASEHLRWLRANGHSTAALTGTDARALAAIAACWTLYTVERNELVLEAVAALAQLMQSSVRPLARALIPWAMDWPDEQPVWTLVEARMHSQPDAGAPRVLYVCDRCGHELRAPSTARVIACGCGGTHRHASAPLAARFCDVCRGTGEILSGGPAGRGGNAFKTCPECKGTKQTTAPLRVELPPVRSVPAPFVATVRALAPDADDDDVRLENRRRAIADGRLEPKAEDERYAARRREREG